jgi:uncharacterized membrane protein
MKSQVVAQSTQKDEFDKCVGFIDCAFESIDFTPLPEWMTIFDAVIFIIVGIVIGVWITKRYYKNRHIQRTGTPLNPSILDEFSELQNRTYHKGARRKNESMDT